MLFHTISTSPARLACSAVLPAVACQGVSHPFSLSAGICFVFLAVCALEDMRTRTVPVLWLAAGAASGIIMDVWLLVKEEIQLVAIPLSLLPGMFLLLTAWLTCQKVGYGDGLCFLVVGLLLGSGSTVLVLLFSLLFASIAGIFLLLARKSTWKATLPFLPFVVAGLLAAAAGGYL